MGTIIQTKCPRYPNLQRTLLSKHVLSGGQAGRASILGMEKPTFRKRHFTRRAQVASWGRVTHQHTFG
ncbi:hypothetical protein LINPERHAP2_LOCUS15099 [Linum perenne]